MRPGDGRSCEELQELVLGHLTETLGPSERERFEAHRASCERCAAHVAKVWAAAHLSCQGLVVLVTEYLEGRLLPAERERFEMHLAICDGCREYVEQMRQTIRLLGKLTEDAIQPEAKRKLLSAFRDW